MFLDYNNLCEDEEVLLELFHFVFEIIDFDFEQLLEISKDSRLLGLSFFESFVLLLLLK